MAKKQAVEVNPQMEELYQRISRAVFPEDVFGRRLLYFDDESGEREAETAEEMEEALLKALKEREMECAPGNFRDDLTRFFAEEAIQMLRRLFHEGAGRIQAGEWGEDLSSDFVVTTRRGKVEVRKFLAEDAAAEIYAGNVLVSGGYGEKAIAKIARDPGQNNLLQNELRVLRVLVGEESSQAKHFFDVGQTFKTTDDRLGVIMPFQTDYYTLEEVRQSEKWRNGVPERHMAWMFNRLLSALGFAHSKNIIHRGINPRSVLIRPRDHNLLATNWCHAVLNAHAIHEGDALDDGSFGAPEIKAGERAIPSSDLYSVGKCMIYVLGGDPETNEMPDNVDPKVQSFLRAFVLESKWQRVSDAWAIHAELVKLVEGLWGPRKFLKFNIFD